MNWIKNFLKITGINVFFILVIIGFFVSAPIFFQVFFDFYQKNNIFLNDGAELASNNKIDNRYQLPNYNNIEWAKQYFHERKLLTTTYYDFVVWRRDFFNGKTINIDKDGIRKTFRPQNPKEREVWMFGGSTMWGNGVDDYNTIPSKVAELGLYNVKNFGEAGYIARQSLNVLIKSYNNSPSQIRTIIFYDGVNDGAQHCGIGTNGISTDRQSQIQKIMKDYKKNKVDSLSVSYLFEPSLSFIKKIKDKMGIKKSYEKTEAWNCHINEERAKYIAKSLVNDWVSASSIAKQNGDRFIAILQPVAFISKTKLDHLESIGKGLERISIKGQQYKAVYPFIREYAENAGIEFYDMSTAFDLDEHIYIDFCHVSPNGNEIIAKNIINLLN